MTELLAQLRLCNSSQELTELGQPLLGKTGWPWGMLFSPVSSFPVSWSGLEKCLCLLFMGATKLPLVTANLSFTALDSYFPPLLPQIHLQKSSVISHSALSPSQVPAFFILA